VTDEEITFMLREGVATGHIPEAETRDRREANCSSASGERARYDAAHPDRMADLDDPEAESAQDSGERPLALSGRGGRPPSK